jgi:outer membrane protein assembly factor BamB
MTAPRYKCSLFLSVFLLTGATAFSEDWPQWRGPHRDGSLSSAAAPATWPERLKLKWKLTVGEGHASPILAGGRIFIFTRQQGKETASSIDPTTGRIVWQQSYAAPYNMNPAAAWHGEGPKSTPLFNESKLYIFGISGILTCWDAATGALKWRKNFSKQYKATWPLFGTAMSPIADRGLVIAHVGGPDDGALTAFDGQTGVEKWRWTGDGPAYASPIIVELGGTRQVVTETQQNLVSVAAASGQLLWKIPFTTDYVQNIPTPLLYRDLVVFSGLANGIFAIRATAKDGKWSTETAWRNDRAALYMSSPVLSGDLIFGFSHYKKGEFFCIDARTGDTQWTSPPRQGENAAVLVSGGNLILLRDEGELIIAKASGKTFEPLRHYTVADSPTWAHPLVLPDGVVIKDKTTLALWGVE